MYICIRPHLTNMFCMHITLLRDPLIKISNIDPFMPEDLIDKCCLVLSYLIT